MTREFIDSNVIIYGFTSDKRNEMARSIMRRGGVISVQVMNEFASVATRKLGMTWPDARSALATIVRRCEPPVPITTDLHEAGIRLAERYQLSVYDGMIAAAALQAGCDALLSEDMHDGLVIDGVLTVRNPFA